MGKVGAQEDRTFGDVKVKVKSTCEVAMKVEKKGSSEDLKKIITATAEGMGASEEEMKKLGESIKIEQEKPKTKEVKEKEAKEKEAAEKTKKEGEEKAKKETEAKKKEKEETEKKTIEEANKKK